LIGIYHIDLSRGRFRKADSEERQSRNEAFDRKEQEKRNETK